MSPSPSAPPVSVTTRCARLRRACDRHATSSCGPS